MAKFEPAMNEHVRRSVSNENISLWFKTTSAKWFDSEVVWGSYEMNTAHVVRKMKYLPYTE
jgi:hypothetical protein